LRVAWAFRQRILLAGLAAQRAALARFCGQQDVLIENSRWH